MQQNDSVAVVFMGVNIPCPEHRAIRCGNTYIFQFGAEIMAYCRGNDLRMAQWQAMQFQAGIRNDYSGCNGESQVRGAYRHKYFPDNPKFADGASWLRRNLHAFGHQKASIERRCPAMQITTFFKLAKLSGATASGLFYLRVTFNGVASPVFTVAEVLTLGFPVAATTTVYGPTAIQPEL
jgi:hypothetical protein